ncbi:MAG TPA: hypothetical protein VM073_01870 [Usitatibacter sp.]|nr:hypothetical protein [Usitatibacter sp.]
MALPAAAQAPSPRPDKGALGGAGTIVQYEESAGTNVIYLEEKGGLTSPLAAPIQPAAEARPPLRKPTRAPAKSANRTSTAAKP